MHRGAVQHIEMRRPCGAQSLIEKMWAQRVPVQRLCPSDLPPAPNTPLSPQRLTLETSGTHTIAPDSPKRSIQVGKSNVAPQAGSGQEMLGTIFSYISDLVCSWAGSNFPVCDERWK